MTEIIFEVHEDDVDGGLVAHALEDLEDTRQADKAMAAYEHDPSGAITLEEYERRRGEKA